MILIHFLILVVDVALAIVLLTSPPMDKVLPQVVTWWILVAILTASGVHSAWRLLHHD